MSISKFVVALAAGLLALHAGAEPRGAEAAEERATDRYAEIPSAKWAQCKERLFDERGRRVDASKMFDLAMDLNYRKCVGMEQIDRRIEAAEKKRALAPKGRGQSIF